MPTIATVLSMRHLPWLALAVVVAVAAEEAAAVAPTEAVTGTDGTEIVKTRRLLEGIGVVWGVAGGRRIVLPSATARRISRRTIRSR